MDPISHFTLGAAFSQSILSFQDRNKLDSLGLRFSAFVGGLAALTPDLDSLIQSAADPLMYIEYHRHFTHSFIFIPFGALIVSLIIKPFTKHSLKSLWVAAMLGLCTHGFLDACTSYGTHLLWPFSEARSAWNNISIIDPLFTLPLILGLILTSWRGKKIFIRVALIYGFFYLGAGAWQRERVKSFVSSELSSEEIVKVDSKPSFGNLWLWRVITTTDVDYRVDAVWSVPFVDLKFYEGVRVMPFDQSRDLPQLVKGSRSERDIERFRFFSDDYLYIVEQTETITTIGDLRYSLLPNSKKPLWVIEIDHHNFERPTPYNTVRNVTKESRAIFKKLLFGEDQLL